MNSKTKLETENEIIEAVIQAAKNLLVETKITDTLEAISFACYLANNNKALFEYFAEKRQKVEGFKQIILDALPKINP